MGPAVVAALVTAVVSSVGTVLAAWVQARAQRPTERAGRQAADPGEPAPAAGVSVVASCEVRPDDRR